MILVLNNEDVEGGVPQFLTIFKMSLSCVMSSMNRLETKKEFIALKSLLINRVSGPTLFLVDLSSTVSNAYSIRSFITISSREVGREGPSLLSTFSIWIRKI